MANLSDLRPLERTPVFIEEDHHQVLPHIFRCVGSKHLPVHGNAMIHFDSHPDLLLPSNVLAGEIRDVQNLYEKLSIENWILPACYLRVIDTIIWVKPPWSNQIPEGHYNFVIGRHKGTNQVKISCLQNYFVAETIVCNPEELLDTKEINLYVITLSQNPLNMGQMNHLREVLVGKPIILDFDLDFYSTRNPFLSLYSEINLYDTLKQIYTFNPIPNHLTGDERLAFALSSASTRRELLENLNDLTNHLAQGGSFNNFEGCLEEDILQKFAHIQKAIHQNCGKLERIDWKLIHDAGCTCDDTDLPHHVSNNEEISVLLRQTRNFVQSLGVTPIIVTVSRSSLDEFCPENQVEMVQAQLIDLLQALVGGDKLEIKNGYQDMQE